MTNNTGIREEFEKAFQEEFKNSIYMIHAPQIEWAARWMADYLANCCGVEMDSNNKEAYITDKEIRALAKELE